MSARHAHLLCALQENRPSTALRKLGTKPVQSERPGSADQVWEPTPQPGAGRASDRVLAPPGGRAGLDHEKTRKVLNLKRCRTVPGAGIAAPGFQVGRLGREGSNQGVGAPTSVGCTCSPWPKGCALGPPPAMPTWGGGQGVRYHQQLRWPQAVEGGRVGVRPPNGRDPATARLPQRSARRAMQAGWAWPPSAGTHGGTSRQFVAQNHHSQPPPGHHPTRRLHTQTCLGR